jgi:hypothetical protein
MMTGSAEHEDASSKTPESGPPGTAPPRSPGRRLLALVKGTPAFVTGLATVVTAAATIIGIVASHRHQQPGPAAAPSVPATAAATATATGTAAPAPPAPAIYWGPRALLISTNTDFDVTPPAVDQSGDIYFATVSAGTALGLSPNYGTELALWTGAGTPGPRQCLDQAQTQSSQGVPVRDGADVCIVTPQHRVALVQVRSIDQQTPDLESRTTVWTMPGS